MSKRAKFLRVPVGPVKGLFEIQTWKGEIDVDKEFDCPCCKEKLKAGMDICQWGMFEDSYITYLICPSCAKAWELAYKVPTYTIFTKRQQKQLLTVKAKSLYEEHGAK